MNSLLRQRIEILAEEGNVEELFELFDKSTSMGTEGVEIRREINLRVPQLAEYYGSKVSFDSFRDFITEYDFLTSPLRDSEVIHMRAIIHQTIRVGSEGNERNPIPFTFDQFVKLFKRGGFEKLVIFPFRINYYEESDEVTWDEEKRGIMDVNYRFTEGVTDEELEDSSSVKLTVNRKEGVMYQFERDRKNFIIRRYTLPVMAAGGDWPDEYQGPREIKPAIVTNFTDYKRDLTNTIAGKTNAYSQIEELYFLKEGGVAKPSEHEHCLGVHSDLKYGTDLQGALDLALDLAYNGESVRIGIQHDWNYNDYYAAYYLNMDTIRVRNFLLNDEEAVFQIADFRLPRSIPWDAYPSYFMMFHRVEQEDKKFNQIRLSSLEGKNYTLANVEPYYIICDELLRDTNEFHVVEYDRAKDSGVYAHKVILY